MSQPEYIRQVKGESYDNGTVAYAAEAFPAGASYPPPPPISGADKGVYIDDSWVSRGIWISLQKISWNLLDATSAGIITYNLSLFMKVCDNTLKIYIGNRSKRRLIRSEYNHSQEQESLQYLLSSWLIFLKRLWTMYDICYCTLSRP